MSKAPRKPFTAPLQPRDSSLAKGSQMKNCYSEASKVKGQARGVKRPGQLFRCNACPGGIGQGVFFYRERFVIMACDTLFWSQCEPVGSAEATSFWAATNIGAFSEIPAALEFDLTGVATGRQVIPRNTGDVGSTFILLAHGYLWTLTQTLADVDFLKTTVYLERWDVTTLTNTLVHTMDGVYGNTLYSLVATSSGVAMTAEKNAVLVSGGPQTANISAVRFFNADSTLEASYDIDQLVVGTPEVFLAGGGSIFLVCLSAGLAGGYPLGNRGSCVFQDAPGYAMTQHDAVNTGPAVVFSREYSYDTVNGRLVMSELDSTTHTRYFGTSTDGAVWSLTPDGTSVNAKSLIDTDTGLLTIDGAGVGTFNGVSVGAIFHPYAGGTNTGTNSTQSRMIGWDGHDTIWLLTYTVVAGFPRLGMLGKYTISTQTYVDVSLLSTFVEALVALSQRAALQYTPAGTVAEVVSSRSASR